MKLNNFKTEWKLRHTMMLVILMSVFYLLSCSKEAEVCKCSQLTYHRNELNELELIGATLLDCSEVTEYFVVDSINNNISKIRCD